jgi:hypothetical protein
MQCLSSMFLRGTYVPIVWRTLGPVCTKAILHNFCCISQSVSDIVLSLGYFGFSSATMVHKRVRNTLRKLPRVSEPIGWDDICKCTADSLYGVTNAAVRVREEIDFTSTMQYSETSDNKFCYNGIFVPLLIFIIGSVKQKVTNPMH